MPIFPLPQFETDLAELNEEDRKAYEALKAPKTLVVRFGSMKLVGEFPYDGTAKPGCGSKLVVRTHRGTEIGEMLTSTCANSGCSKSVSRKELLQYVQNSGGRDYPFFQDGRVLRIATVEDLDRQNQLEQSRHALRLEARAIAERLHVTAKMVDAEPILGNELLTFFYLSEERLDLRDLHRELANHFRMRIDLRQVGARDEARLTADYEKCGQYCCCKNFLKVLKPVSMKSAKVQKATLDPMKISGRCGRLMCCLRYEDSTYEELKAKLPRKKSRVGTPEGDGTVLDGQILTQLVLVELDDVGPDGKIRQVAIAVEDLGPATNPKAPVRELPPERPRMGRGPGGPPQRPMTPSMPRPSRPVEAERTPAQPFQSATADPDAQLREPQSREPQQREPQSRESQQRQPREDRPEQSQGGPKREFRSVRGPNRPSGPKPAQPGPGQSGQGQPGPGGPGAGGQNQGGQQRPNNPPQGRGPRDQGPRDQGPRDQNRGPRPGAPREGRPQRDSVDDILASLDDADGLGGRQRPQGRPDRGSGPNQGNQGRCPDSRGGRRDQRPNRGPNRPQGGGGGGNASGQRPPQDSGQTPPES
jgi:cell fate regulator YaaT (PSP1 superfamily)